jgi:NAD(P)H-hydrate epimerase
VVVAGKGNNGADGRAAAALLSRHGADVQVLEAAGLQPGQLLPVADLVVDAAYGTGLQRAYSPPSPGRSPVLAVDIPSGLSGLTGEVPEGGGAMRAAATITFASLKPGLLLGAGPDLAGEVEVVDIGLGALVDAAARCWLVVDADVAALLPRRSREAHKWQTALQVVAGSPGMTGAPWLVSRSALRAGAGYVRLSMPGVDPSVLPPGELVHLPVPASGWHARVLAELSRVKALVVGPGLGSVGGRSTGAGSTGTAGTGTAGTGAGSTGTGGTGTGGEAGARALPGGEVGLLVAAAAVPTVIDADGLNAIGSLDGLAAIVARRRQPTVITPHAGELTRLSGHAPGPDRLAEARDAAARSGAIVLLKGSTTVIAAPDGRALMAASGDARLATAGTGDVLSGVIGAFLARGVPAFEAAALAAHVHGRAARAGYREGLVAGDLPDLVAGWLSELPRP